ncbi:putative membrane protein [Pseudoclavibacter sp. JAI123]|uniref:TMEM175 family protein n=1 Tax=Pseudoclavibacter sp. JAI123 TaxID=2723065 RepID=UPI0015CAD35A|nr:TMEM175 family protein [Pseudoclavibacter sp. JAI123]NYF12396.1 putative membrane protein [Pseudoclavibacter sp. JAI123]
MASRSYARGTIEFDRGLTFFDAIYAVAITLLIVDIKPPTAEHWTSWDAFAGSGVLDQLLAFTISFFVIANFWKVNHRLMGQVDALDGALLNANIVAMFFIVVLPFTTASMSESTVDSQPLPVVVYAISIICASLAQHVIWVIAVRRGLTEDSVAARRRSAFTFVVPAVFALSIPVAFLFGPDPARYTWLLLLLTGPVTSAIQKRMAERDGDGTADS